MGMAASQARLLMITSRMHDIELEAQQIQNAKTMLATQQDEAYEEYQKALDATTLTFASMNTQGIRSDVVANFNNLFSMNRANPEKNSEYILIDSRGRVVVEDEVYEGYMDFLDESSCPHDAYSFAMYMITGGEYPDSSAFTDDDFLAAMSEVFAENAFDEEGDLFSLVQQVNQYLDYSAATLEGLVKDPGETTDPQGYQEAFSALMNYFFRHYGNQLFNNQDIEDNYSQDDFNYYVHIFTAIQQHGGCIKISDFNGPNGDAAVNSEWLTAMIESGQMTIEGVKVDSQGNITINGVSVSSDANLNYTPTSSIDKAALARAEAEYEHTLKVIDRKDKKFDLDLSKLETERTALDKQRESIEKVRDDNIERTFGIFS